jgi:hypothetical protein
LSYPATDPLARLLPRGIYTLVKCGRGYRVPYTRAAWQALEASGEYPPAFFGFLARFLAALEGPEWPAGTYFPGGWFRKLVAAGADPARAAISPQALGPFYGDEVRVDARGEWTVGPKVVTGAVLRFFLKNLHYDEELQRYLICYELETHRETRYVHHESLPLRIVALEQAQGEQAQGRVCVRVNDGTLEPLRWETLRLDAGEQVYCAIRPQRLPAQFADGPRFRLLDRLEERAGRWFAPDAPGEGALDLHAPWAGAGSLAPLPAIPQPVTLGTG